MEQLSIDYELKSRLAKFRYDRVLRIPEDESGLRSGAVHTRASKAWITIRKVEH
jgi:hypothetical protein